MKREEPLVDAYPGQGYVSSRCVARFGAYSPVHMSNTVAEEGSGQRRSVEPDVIMNECPSVQVASGGIRDDCRGSSDLKRSRGKRAGTRAARRGRRGHHRRDNLTRVQPKKRKAGTGRRRRHRPADQLAAKKDRGSGVKNKTGGAWAYRGRCS